MFIGPFIIERLLWKNSKSQLQWREQKGTTIDRSSHFYGPEPGGYADGSPISSEFHPTIGWRRHHPPRQHPTRCSSCVRPGNEAVATKPSRVFKQAASGGHTEQLGAFNLRDPMRWGFQFTWNERWSLAPAAAAFFFDSDAAWLRWRCQTCSSAQVDRPTKRENGHVSLASRPVTSVIGISSILRLRRFIDLKKITFKF